MPLHLRWAPLGSARPQDPDCLQSLPSSSPCALRFQALAAYMASRRHEDLDDPLSPISHENWETLLLFMYENLNGPEASQAVPLVLAEAEIATSDAAAADATVCLCL
jgi:hypothetical protein